MNYRTLTLTTFALVLLGVLMVAVRACSAQAYAAPYEYRYPPPIVVPQPPLIYQPAPQIYQRPGTWTAYRRPTWLGDVLFGPVWVFTPQEQPRQ